IRYKDRRTITRSKKLINPVSSYEEIFLQAKDIFLKNWNGEKVRLLGITGNDLVEEENAFKQLDLFTYEQDAEKEPLIRAVEHLKEKFGSDIIEEAGRLVREKKQNTGGTDTSFNKDFLADFPSRPKKRD